MPLILFFFYFFFRASSTTRSEIGSSAPPPPLTVAGSNKASITLVWMLMLVEARRKDHGGEICNPNIVVSLSLSVVSGRSMCDVIAMIQDRRNCAENVEKHLQTNSNLNCNVAIHGQAEDYQIDTLLTLSIQWR
ncbi:uncharacterized protein BO66DRAFT_101825 [Aspergillus aculeatinus CBS 121060]|uniref:Uncharacterized protein n=1 Tax=Aspergillus aculeatinus CBS 121060 TaxID=1448322 RepID=A0ACD1H7E3_9EURO|nr:hypothetical protein BO66DRAFT_101825 [Aspergillus aculeatinus CBS 121060]RAH69496.1 hypothetical protein BO66DRAFT_101825 [Aspergillus aculeatinus CBS 121060]